MQPMASEDTRAVLLTGSSTGTRKVALNSAEFLARKDGDVAAEDVFFHQYFKALGKGSAVAKKSKKARDAEEDVDEDGSDDEDEVWKAMVSHAPDLEGLNGSDDEISDLEEFEEAMDNDDDGDEEEDDEAEGGDKEEIDSDVVMDMEDDDGSVDIEAGIFDDSDDDDQSAVGMDKDENTEESDFEGLSDEASTKDKKPSKKTLQKREDRDRKKKLKALPTFASAADYQKMLDDDEDEDLG